ncbi:hypothetical protein ACTI_73950 [Actinoplanes sp. OR16]|nr:hypothetical protein ACTI_73950 [Actinoplanes sp. OR16]
MALVAVAALLLAGGLVWWLGPLRARPWVPTCTDLAPALQDQVGGGWTVTDPDEGREGGEHQSSTTCTISFVTADQKYTGTLDMAVAAALDEDGGADEVAGAPCGDSDRQVAVPPGYQAYRVCSTTTGATTLVTVWAAKNDRWGSAGVSINLRDGDAQAATAYAHDVARLAIDQALTMTEPE